MKLVIAGFMLSFVGIWQGAAVQAGDRLPNLVPRSLSISPDGRHMTYARYVPNDTPAAARVEASVSTPLWLVDTKTLKRTALPSGRLSPGSGPQPTWSPDGRFLAYFSDSGGGLVPTVWDTERGAVIYTARSRAERGIRPRWVAESTVLVFIAVAPPEESGMTPGVTSDDGSEPVLFGQVASPTGFTILSSEPTADKASKTLARPKRMHRIVAIDVQAKEEKVIARGSPFVDLLTAERSRVVVGIGFEPYSVDVGASSYYATSAFVIPIDGSASPDIARMRVLFRGKSTLQGRDVSLSPSGRYLAYTEAGAGATGGVRIVEVASGAAREIGTEVPLENDVVNFSDWQEELVLQSVFGSAQFGPMWSKDEKSVFAIRRVGRQDTEVPFRFELWKLDLAGSASRVPLDPRYSVVGLAACSTARFQPCVTRQQSVLARMRDVASGELFYTTLDLASGTMNRLGKIATVEVGEGPRALDDEVVESDFIMAEGRMLAVDAVQSFEVPPSLRLVDASSRTTKSLDLINDTTPERSSRLMRIKFDAPHNARQVAALQLPVSASRAHPVAVIQWVYWGGGHATARKPYFEFDGNEAVYRPLIASGRYAVLATEIPRYRGDGRDCDRTGEVAEAALKAAAATGLIDPKRAGLMGYSFGGYHANCIVTRSSVFRAAVSGAGLADLVFGCFRVYGCTGASIYPAAVRNRILEETDLDLLLKDSPVHNVKRVVTPTLLFYGKDDSLSMQSQYAEFFSAIKSRGVPTQLAAYDGLDHGTIFGHPDLWPRIISWFDTHLRPKQVEKRLPPCRDPHRATLPDAP